MYKKDYNILVFSLFEAHVQSYYPGATVKLAITLLYTFFYVFPCLFFSVLYTYSKVPPCITCLIVFFHMYITIFFLFSMVHILLILFPKVMTNSKVG